MFDLTPISTTNLFTLAQIIVVVIGFYFAWSSLEAARSSLELSTKNARAQLFNQIVVQGRDLQHSFMEIFHGGSSEADLSKKQNIYTGMVIGYYASCFELRNVLALPQNVDRLLDAELRELMREPTIRDKWDDVRHLHSQDFVVYLDGLRGVK